MSKPRPLFSSREGSHLTAPLAPLPRANGGAPHFDKTAKVPLLSIHLQHPLMTQAFLPRPLGRVLHDRASNQGVCTSRALAPACWASPAHGCPRHPASHSTTADHSAPLPRQPPVPPGASAGARVSSLGFLHLLQRTDALPPPRCLGPSPLPVPTTTEDRGQPSHQGFRCHAL